MFGSHGLAISFPCPKMRELDEIVALPLVDFLALIPR